MNLVNHIVLRCLLFSFILCLRLNYQQKKKKKRKGDKKKKKQKFNAAKELTRKLMMMVSILRPKILYDK